VEKLISILRVLVPWWLPEQLRIELNKPDGPKIFAIKKLA